MFRIRAEITCAFWRERRAGRCKAPRRRRCGDIVEERQRSRCPPAAAPPWAAAPRPAGFVARSLQTKQYARRSRLAIGPGSLQQNVQVIYARILRVQLEMRVSFHLTYLKASKNSKNFSRCSAYQQGRRALAATEGAAFGGSKSSSDPCCMSAAHVFRATCFL